MNILKKKVNIALPLKRRAFTLAEVLITLVIIGVIAAATIPTLINNTKKQEYVAGLKKANSVLSQAVYKIGQNKGYPVGDYSFFEDVDFVDELAKVTNVVKKCNSNSCFPDYSSYKRLGGDSFDNMGQDKSAILADGQILGYLFVNGVWSVDKLSPLFGLTEDDTRNAIGRVIIDVNGNKPPNVMGRDVFFFVLVNGKGIIPAGADNSANCNKNNYGYTCTAKVLRENAMNY